MCGIVGFTGHTAASDYLIKGLKRLEYRGYDSAGITVYNQDFQTVKTTQRIKDLHLKTESVSGNTGIGHTRWATHGGASIENAHPHLSNDKKFAVVHNGIIENYSEIKKELENEGFTFKSETDTEVIPMLLQKHYKGDIKSAVFDTLSRLKGSYALSILCTDFPDMIITAKNFSPLIIGLGEKENYVASDISAIGFKTKKTVYLSDGDVAFITPENTVLYGANREEKPLCITLLTAEEFDTTKKGYDHYMLKEIYEQPSVFKKTAENYIKNGEIHFDDFSADITDFDRIDIIGCGSAYNAGMVAKYVFEELLRIPVSVQIASEYRYSNPLSDSKTLTIAISQSGETADTISALEEAKLRGSYTLSIVNVKESSLSKISDSVIYTHAGAEIAVATTKGYLTQLAVLYLFGIMCSGKLGTVSEEKLKNLTENFLKLPEQIEKIINNSEDIKEIAKILSLKNALFFIGRNSDYAVCLEAGLKLKEISYIHAESYPAGELKHGTISLIEEGMPVISLCVNKNLRLKTLSNIKEASARGGYIISCAIIGDSEIADISDRVIFIPETERLLTPILEVIPFQLLAYYTALYKGCDIDKPRNLAKSVTVE